MLSYALSLSLLAGSALGVDFGYSCQNEAFDPTSTTLTASCGTGDGKGTYNNTSINLNDCFAYSNGELYVSFQLLIALALGI